MSTDMRRQIRSVLPSHVQLGSEPVHERLEEDYGAQMVGGASDMGNFGTQNWPGSAEMDADIQQKTIEETFRRAVQVINEYASGSLQDDEAISMFEALIQTGMIEFMNESIQRTAKSLVQAGYISPVQESAFTRSIGDQEAQKGTPNIQVKSGAAQYQQNKGTAPVSTVSDIGSQKAQGGPADVPTPPAGPATTKGHAPFPDSGGTKENPADVPKPVGKQKAGPNHGDEMAGGKGIEVGNSLQQSKDPESDDGDYEGSKVGSVN